MEEETQKHLRALRLLVALALLIGCLSFGFSYVLFKDVSIPLDRLRTHQIKDLENKVDELVSSQVYGALVQELQMSLVHMQALIDNTSGEIQAQAQKTAAETKALLEKFQTPKE